jgi:hypothetical protein
MAGWSRGLLSIREVEDGDEYVNFVNDKAAALQQKESRHLLNLI